MEVRIVSRSDAASSVEVAGSQQLADCLGTHATGEVLTEAPGASEAVAQLTEQGLVSDDFLNLELLELDPRAIEPVDGILGVVVDVLTPRLHVVVGVAHLECPGLDDADVVTRHLAVGAQAQIVRQVAQLGLIGRGALLHHFAQQPSTDLAGLVQRRGGAGAGLDQSSDPLSVGLFEIDLIAAEEAQPRLEGVASLGALGALELLHRIQLGADQRARGGRPCGHVVELLGAEPAIVTDRSLTHQLLDLARVFSGNALCGLGQQTAGQLAGIVEHRGAALLRPVVERAGPVVVVLVEALVRAVHEELAAALHALLERGQSLLLVEQQALLLDLHLALEFGDVAITRLLVDRGDDGCGEVQHLLELFGSDVEQVADPRRHALEEPDVAHGGSQVDMTHALAPHLLAGHLDAAALADDALVADALVLAAVALPVLGGTEDALAEETVLLRLERSVVDRLGLGHLTG